MVKKLNIEDACNFIQNLMLSKYLIVCIGTLLRGDDGACLEFCNKLRDYNIYENVINCEFGLENCISEISREKFDKIAICDAVISESIEPGSIVHLNFEDINEDIVFATTHSIPLSLSMKILQSIISLSDIKIFGIVAYDLGVKMELSPIVMETIDKITNCLRNRQH